MKQKTRKLSIRIKILLPASFIIILICLILGFNSYQQLNNGMVTMGVEQADMASAMAVKVIDGELLKGLTSGNEDSNEYQSVQSSMIEMQPFNESLS